MENVRRKGTKVDRRGAVRLTETHRDPGDGSLTAGQEGAGASGPREGTIGRTQSLREMAIAAAMLPAQFREATFITFVSSNHTTTSATRQFHPAPQRAPPTMPWDPPAASRPRLFPVRQINNIISA
jgi:hypothetical protein